MKRQDFIVIGCVAVILLACALTPNFLDRFIYITKTYPYLSSFAKFFVLAGFGESLGLRLATGNWNRPGFGIIAHAFVWGVLGLGIKMSFTLYSVGVPAFLAELGLLDPTSTTFGSRLLRAFGISLIMNCTWAPFFMTLHKITDIHIEKNGGTMRGLFRPIDMVGAFNSINWSSLWGFVFKKLIPFFWVPAHTLTFMLPPHFQVVFAAALGVVLGVTLAMAGQKKAPKPAEAK